MSDRADNAGTEVEVDDLHKVRAILRTSDFSGAQAELEAALRDVDESVFADSLFGARFRVCALHEALRATRAFPVTVKSTGRKSTTRAALVAIQPDAQARGRAVARAGLGQRPPPARRVSVARLRSPRIDAIARNRSILG